LLHESDELNALEAQEKLKQARSHLEGRLVVLDDEGLPEVEPDISDLEAKAAEAGKIATAISERGTRARSALEEFRMAIEKIGALDAGTGDLRRRADLTQRAQLVCRGQVAPKVSLRRWVLGRELERVVDAASQHLTQMSGGRYTLRRVTDSVGGNSAKGLDLEVLDAHTGRARKPNSLSGGEQFQASLSLALGLADVVSRGGAGNGRKIEALFVDEGFGSLDPRALDDAIETLHQLQATGRMVGAITHVDAMKERLHAGIVVTRLPDGHGSTLTVNP
jgi:DNA repair protein SbcC/Rad50